MLPGIRIRPERMEQAAATGYLNATDLADYLVRRGLPFREAHHCVGRAVRLGLDRGRELHELSLEELRSCSALIEADVFAHLEVRAGVDRRTAPGATGASAVLAAVAAAERRLG
jgi:argininosuccinate lyase